MKTFEDSWTDKQGLKFYAKGWEPDQAPKAAVAFVHGVGEHIGRYEYIAAALNKAGYAAMGFDLRGHGRSGGLRGHTPSVEAYMQDVDLLLEHVRGRYAGVPVFLYGHSLGGIIVLNYGLRRKPDLAGVVATSSGLHTSLEQQPAKILAARVLGSLVPTSLLASGLKTSMLSHDPQVEKTYLADPLVHDKMSLGFGKAMLGATKWALEHAAEFPLPLLLVHGKEDAVAYPSSSEEFAAAMGGRAKLILWDGLYHETHNELNKDEVIQTTIGWMDDQLKK